MTSTLFPIAADDTEQQIDALSAAEEHGDRVHGALAVLDAAISERAPTQTPPLEGECVELDADDLFDLVAAVMALQEPEARRVGLRGLRAAVLAEDFDQLRIGCRAVHRFCHWAEMPSGSLQ